MGIARKNHEPTKEILAVSVSDMSSYLEIYFQVSQEE